MHERLVHGLFTPFPAVLIPASYVFVKAFFPWYSQTSQAAGARRAVRSRPGSAQSPRPPLSTALTVSIKAQEPVDKLARSAGCRVRSRRGRLSPGCVWAPQGESRASGGRANHSRALGRSWRSRWGAWPGTCNSLPLAWEDSTLYSSHYFSLEPHPRSSWGTFHDLENVESSHSYFCLFFIKSCTKSRPLSFLPTLVAFLVTGSPALSVKTWECCPAAPGFQTELANSDELSP